MKISIVSYGHVDSIAALSKYLSLRGHKVQLFIVVYDERFINSIVDFDLSKLSFGVHSISELRNTSEDTDRFISYFDGNAGCYLLKLPTRSFKHFVNQKYISECAGRIKDFGSEIVHFNGDSAHQLSFYLRLTGIPKILTIHDLVPHSGEAGNRWQNNLFRNIHYRSKYLFIQHSEMYSKMMAEITPVKSDSIFTVYYGPFDFYEQYPTGSEHFPSVLFFGRISKYKGLRYFCEAAAKVSATLPGISFTIMGRGEPDFDIDEFKNKADITFINRHINNAELAMALSTHSVVVVPYTDATQSGVVLTAYAFNKPVVASRVGGIPEVVEDGKTGILVPPKDSNSIAEALLSLLSSPDKLRKMNGYIAEKRSGNENRFLSWHTIAAETETVYKKAIERFS